MHGQLPALGRVLFGKQGACCLGGGRPLADTGLLVRHVKTTLEGLENPARRQGCSAAAAGALRARANSDSGREEHRGLQGAGSAGRQ